MIRVASATSLCSKSTSEFRGLKWKQLDASGTSPFFTANCPNAGTVEKTQPLAAFLPRSALSPQPPHKQNGIEKVVAYGSSTNTVRPVFELMQARTRSGITCAP